ncbi:MAG: glycosyltransferase family 4 protein [Phycisphaerales bacterium]
MPAESPRPPAADDRPVLAILAPEITPYRLHFHRRIVREVPEMRLCSLVTWGSERSPWKPRTEEEARIGAVRLGEGEGARRTGRLATARVEWEKARAVGRWLDRHRPAAVMAAGYNELANLGAIRWAHRRGVPALMWADSNIHGDTATGPKRMAKRALLRWVLSRTNAVLPCGSLGREYYLRYGVPAERIFLCPYEPDYEQIAACPPERTREVAGRFGLAPSRRRILVCGRLAPVKRPDLAVDAFAAIADERPEWDLVFAGDGPLREAVGARIPERLRARVVFTGFIGEQGTVTALYHACDVLLHPAEFEPWALVINEAAAAGMAIVTTSVVGAAAELVRSGVNGRLCPPRDLPALIEGLREVTHAERLAPMRAASLRLIEGWRREADPVQGLRRALESCGVLGTGNRPPPRPRGPQRRQTHP